MRSRGPARRTVPDLLAAEYGLEGELSRLPGENENWMVRVADGRRFVLKIEVDVDPAMPEFEVAVVEALQRTGSRLRLPSAIPGRGGATVTRSGTGESVRLLEFVDGTAWGAAGEPSPALCSDLGGVLAALARDLASVDASVPRDTHRWDLAAAAAHRGRVALIPAERRGAVEWAFHLYSANQRALPGLPHGLIHGDANDENVLVDGDRVVGLLDFGDCVENPLVCELAIALAYVMQRSAEPFECAAHVVAGYHAERGLTADEFEVLFPLITGRLAVTLTVCAERRGLDASRSTWFVSEQPAWDLLLRLIDLDPREASRRLGCRAGLAPDDAGAEPETLLERRSARINPALSVAYREPLKMVRGRGQFLFDHRGRPFLDLVNNVCHVGHCHPHVVAAGQRQMARLNTNTRYLYDGLTDYAERLCATLPDELDTCFLVNSGSEANELALRLARTHTGREDVLVVDDAYHGHTSALIAISPYKFMGRGGPGRAERWVHVVPVADGYRGAHKGQGVETGRAYADELARVIAESERPIAAFITESLLSCGGQVVPPDGYFARAFEYVRAAGGVCIADEVQVGFARTGTHFWAFERQGVVPDIVVMGKPIGNGHPMAAVVTRVEIAASFANGMEFFATFGGNPVSCAIGSAVLDVIEDEGLQQHAREVGARLRSGLADLADDHPLIGEVRGAGLFLGVELVRDRVTLEPAAAEAAELVERMKQRGMLLSTDGPLANVIKLKPPLVLTADDVDMVVRAFGEVLGELG